MVTLSFCRFEWARCRFIIMQYLTLPVGKMSLVGAQNTNTQHTSKEILLQTTITQIKLSTQFNLFTLLFSNQSNQIGIQCVQK
jgi:hypothetical protein